MKNINICFIGGGSRLWAVTLMKDLSRAPDLTGTLRLYDIDYEAAFSNQELGGRIFAANAADNGAGAFAVRAEKRLEDALDGADFVIISIEPGPTEKRFVDLEIPARYGILQTVGDTIGPGGIFRAIRSVPVFRDFARRIKKHCPQAWVINYTNPMTWCTNTLSREEPSLKVLGCCHEVFGTQKYLARKVADWCGVEVPNHKDIALDVCGVNHFTFALAAAWDGQDLYPRLQALAADPSTFADRSDVATERRAKEEWFSHDHLVALDLLRTHGNLGAAGDRHLVEFVPWYLADEGELHRYGVVRTPYEWRLREAERKRKKVYGNDELAAEPSEEEGVDIIRALLGLAPLYTNLNFPNRGQIGWLPAGLVVETNAYISKNLIVPASTGAPTASVRKMISSVAEEQALVLDGLFEEREELVLQGFLHDPLVRLPAGKAMELFGEMKREMG